jgi:hypothetical protein
VRETIFESMSIHRSCA